MGERAKDTPRKMFTSGQFKEIIRFVVSGIVSTLICYMGYYICLLWFSPNVSFVMGYTVAMLVNYILTTAFTFKVRATKKKAMGFIVSNGINYMLCAVFLNMFLWIGLPKTIAPIPMYACAVPINFLIVKFVMKG